MIAVTADARRRRIGQKMLMATAYVAAHPGCPKMPAAQHCGPNESLRFGYEIVNRAIAARLISARPLTAACYSLTVTEAGLAALALAEAGD